jgi:hypothetical protein
MSAPTYDFFTDLDRLRLPSTARMPPTQPAAAPPLTPKPKPKPKKIMGEFLKGPIPLPWLTVASKLAGKGPLAVALAVWFEAGRRKSKEVRLTSTVLERFNVNRKAKYRALESLEKAGLVSVRREARRNPKVTILDHPELNGAETGAEGDPAGSDSLSRVWGVPQ